MNYPWSAQSQPIRQYSMCSENPTLTTRNAAYPYINPSPRQQSSYQAHDFYPSSKRIKTMVDNSTNVPSLHDTPALIYSSSHIPTSPATIASTISSHSTPAPSPSNATMSADNGYEDAVGGQPRILSATIGDGWHVDDASAHQYYTGSGSNAGVYGYTTDEKLPVSRSNGRPTIEVPVTPSPHVSCQYFSDTALMNNCLPILLDSNQNISIPAGLTRTVSDAAQDTLFGGFNAMQEPVRSQPNRFSPQLSQGSPHTLQVPSADQFRNISTHLQRAQIFRNAAPRVQQQPLTISPKEACLDYSEPDISGFQGSLFSQNNDDASSQGSFDAGTEHHGSAGTPSPVRTLSSGEESIPHGQMFPDPAEIDYYTQNIGRAGSNISFEDDASVHSDYSGMHDQQAYDDSDRSSFSEHSPSPASSYTQPVAMFGRDWTVPNSAAQQPENGFQWAPQRGNYLAQGSTTVPIQLGVPTTFGNGMPLPAQRYMKQEYERLSRSPSPSDEHHHQGADHPVDPDTGYSCTVPGCTLRFSKPSEMSKHRREAHRHTPFGPGSQKSQLSGPSVCKRINMATGKVCNIVFSRPYDLTRHEDTIHNPSKRKATCELCTDDKTFSRKDALTRHKKVKHNVG
jgi:hypothetical protein